MPVLSRQQGNHPHADDLRHTLQALLQMTKHGNLYGTLDKANIPEPHLSFHPQTMSESLFCDSRDHNLYLPAST